MSRRRKALGASVGELFEPTSEEKAEQPISSSTTPPPPPPVAPTAPTLPPPASRSSAASTAGEVPTAVAEVLGFPLRQLEPLARLTCVPFTLVCEVVTTSKLKLYGQLVVVTTSRDAHNVARAKGLPIFLGGELPLIALAVEHDRASHAQMAMWLERKLAEPRWRVDEAVTRDLGDVAGTLEPQNWPTGRVLHELGLRLLAVGTGSETPVFGEPAAESAPLEQGQGQVEPGQPVGAAPASSAGGQAA